MRKKVWLLTLIAIMLLANLSACGGEEETAPEAEEASTDEAHAGGSPPATPDMKLCQIAFTSDRDGGLEIYVMDADGSNVQQLTFNDSDDRLPAWSPLCK